jgi:Glycosyltransferase
VCRVHNIEHHIWGKLADHEKNFLKKNYLRLLTGRLRAYELDVLKKFDCLLPISKQEENYINLHKINKTLYLPFGVEDRTDLPDIPMEENSCYHIGSMDWAPNVEGVEWFLDEIWSEIKNQFPEHIFYIAGKNMPAGIRARKDTQTEVVGEVDDFIEFSLSKNIMIVPLLSGGGIRIKILEAMALGKTIISTSLGAEGIGVKSGKELWIADTKEEFMDAIRVCFGNPSIAKQIGNQAKTFVLQHYKMDSIYSDLIQQLKHWK